jgi:hypothetical protein
MVFYDKAAIMLATSTHQDTHWDTSSIDSTHSRNFGTKRSKIDPKKINTDNHHEWHVVPSGGAKARTSDITHHPYPCRYDEYDIYLSTGKKKHSDHGTKQRINKMLTGEENNNQEAKTYTADETTTYDIRNESKSAQKELVDKAQPEVAQGNHYSRQHQKQKPKQKGEDNKVNYQKDNATGSNNKNNQHPIDGEDNHDMSVMKATHSENGNKDRGHNTTNGTDGTDDNRDESGDGNEGIGGNGNEEENGSGSGNDKGNRNEDGDGKVAGNGNGNENGKGNGNGTGNGNGNADGKGNGNENGNGNGQGNENENENGNGNGIGNGNNNEKEKDKETTTTATNPGHDIKLLQTFTVEFNIRTIPANKIGFIHKEFIKEILTVAPFTTFEASNKRTMPTPTKISNIDQFPSNHLLHQKFFYRLDIREKVKYTHHVYSPVSVLDIKRRVMPFLQEHNIGMWNDEISNNSKVRVCWILNAHSRVSYKPKMKNKMCIGINQQQANYGDDNNRLLTQLPVKMHDIDLYTKIVSHQGHQTEAVCVMAYKPAAPVIRELVGMLDHAYLGNGTSIVSDAAVRELDGNKYSQIIDENTAFHQNTRTISVKFFHDLYWNQKYRPCKEANYTTIREWVMTGSGVVSIEPTKDTESEGRYIILCKSEGFPAFKRILQVMCQSLVKTIEENDDLRAIALEKYQQYPTIIGPHKIGKYAEQNAKGLLSRIDAPTVPKPAIKRISTKIEFDFGSAEGFPAMQPGILTRRTNSKKNQKQQTWATVATPGTMDTGNTSIASEPSEAGKSLQSVRTGITNTDQQTLQSEAMSVLTEFISQARQEDAERRREEKEDRRIEREERRAEADIRQRNEEKRQRNEERRDENNRLMFQSMMALMAQNSTGQPPIVNQRNTNNAPATGTDTIGETQRQESIPKKRKNGEAATTTATILTTQETGKDMDVDEEDLDMNQQHHDKIQDENVRQHH